MLLGIFHFIPVLFELVASNHCLLIQHRIEPLSSDIENHQVSLFEHFAGNETSHVYKGKQINRLLLDQHISIDLCDLSHFYSTIFQLLSIYLRNKLEIKYRAEF